jgi:hypothetical protein
MHDAWSAASSKGMPSLRCIPETVQPAHVDNMADLIAEVNATLLDKVAAALTQPLNNDEIHPQPVKAEPPSRIVFKGTLQEVNQFFYRRGWTDGLPIIPPTEEAVAEMLTGTDLPPDYLVGKMEPRLGKATVEKIAINAVMGGALPTYMPLLIACVRAGIDPVAHGHGWAVSTGSWAPLYIFNGRVRNDLYINSGVGCLSPGDIANAAIGRSMGLIVKNIRGTRKGVEDMGTMGNPMKYSLVAAENEEESPWEPLSIEQGFTQDDSTISLFFPNCFSQAGTFPNVIYNVPIGPGVVCLMVTPRHAQAIAKDGWTKQKLKVFLSEYTRKPLYQMTHKTTAGFEGRTESGTPVFEGRGKFDMPFNAMDPVKLIPNPEALWIFVAGGMTDGITVMRGSPRFDLGGGKRVNLVTRKIDLPKNWDKLVAKYKNMVPKFGMY